MFGHAHARRVTTPKTAGHAAGLQKINLADIPAHHPVTRFHELYAPLAQGALLPHEEEIFRAEGFAEVFPWAMHIEPIELEGQVDFKIIRQGSKCALRAGGVFREQWMRETMAPEFVEARHSEIVAASILRKQLYSKGATPAPEKAFLLKLRGVFPMFADNQARLRLMLVEAEPYAVT